MPFIHPIHGTWYSDFRAVDPETGHRRRFRLCLGVSGSQRAAEAEERRMIVELERRARAAGHLPPVAGEPVVARLERPEPVGNALSGLADLWLETVVATVRKPSYYRTCESHVRNYILAHFGEERDIATIGHVDVLQFRAWALSTSFGKAGRNPGAKTINNVIGTLSSMFASAVTWKYLRENPCSGVEPLPLPPQAFRFYEEAQSDAWLAKCAAIEPAWYPLFLAGFRTGLRLGELFALGWGDLDLVQGRLHVRRSWDGRAQMTTLPKGGRGREVAMSPLLVATLRAHRHLRGELVFCDANGDHLTRDMLKHPWERVTLAAGLPRIRPHDMRHSFASQLAIRATPLKAIQELLGHADIQTTMRYAHLMPGAESAYVALLDGDGSGHSLATPGMATAGIQRRKRKDRMEAAGVEPDAVGKRGGR